MTYFINNVSIPTLKKWGLVIMHQFKPKVKARKYALQALYGWAMTDNPPHEIEMHFLADRNTDNCDINYFRKLLYAIPEHFEELDAAFSEHLDRPFAKLDLIELTILRIATYELCYCIEMPYKTVISEAISLAKSFGATDSHKFINGVLDKTSQEVRKVSSNLETAAVL